MGNIFLEFVKFLQLLLLSLTTWKLSHLLSLPIPRAAAANGYNAASFSWPCFIFLLSPYSKDLLWGFVAKIGLVVSEVLLAGWNFGSRKKGKKQHTNGTAQDRKPRSVILEDFRLRVRLNKRLAGAYFIASSIATSTKGQETRSDGQVWFRFPHKFLGRSFSSSRFWWLARFGVNRVTLSWVRILSKFGFLMLKYVKGRINANNKCNRNIIATILNHWIWSNSHILYEWMNMKYVVWELALYKPILYLPLCLTSFTLSQNTNESVKICACLQ